MWVDLRICKAYAQERVGCDGGGGAGQQAPERVRAVASQFHLIGDLFEGGLDSVAPLGDDLGLPCVFRTGNSGLILYACRLRYSSWTS